MPMKCSRRPAQAYPPLIAPPPGPRRRSGARRRAWPGSARPPPSPRASPRRRGSPPPPPAAAPRPRLRRQLGIGQHRRRARPLHPGGVGALVVAGRVRIGHQDRRPAGRGQLEDRAARASQDQVGGGEEVGQAGGVVPDQGVAVAVRGRLEPALAAPRGRGGRSGAGPGTRGRRARRRLRCAAKLTERAPWLPPTTNRQRASGAIPKRRRAAARSAARISAGTGRPVTR